MRRIMVIGNIGAGKSTFARRIHEISSVDLHHLDKYYFLSPTEHLSDADWFRSVRSLSDKDSWIMDGNYPSTLGIRAERADTIFILDPPRIVCFFNIIKRSLKGILLGKSRNDSPFFKCDMFNVSILRRIWRFKSSKHRYYSDILKMNNKTIHYFKSMREMQTYLADCSPNSETRSISPFTCIQDTKKNIYVVRIAGQGKYYSKLLYSYEDGLYVKIKATQQSEYSKYHRWVFENEIMDIWVPHRVDKHTASEHQVLKKIYDMSMIHDARIYVIGSRLLRLDGCDSDWDYLIECLNPNTFYSDIIRSIPEIRPYSKSELTERTQRYGYPYSHYSSEELMPLFERTCTYTKYNDKDIGLFFIKSFDNIWAESNTLIHSLVNCNILAESDSFSMPRMLKVMTSDGTIINVVYIDWLLYGIEVFTDNKVDFFNLHKISDNLFTLDNENGYVKFH